MKISKTCKFFGIVHNVTAKGEKGFLILTVLCTAIKLLSAFGMDRSVNKTIKTTKR